MKCDLSDKRRLVVMAIGLFGMLAFLTLQFFKLQVLEGKKWEEKALRQHQFVVKEPYKRGVFYTKARFRDIDHPYKALVKDIPMFHLYVDPYSLPVPLKDEVASQLSEFLKNSKKSKGFIKEQIFKKSRSRKICMWISRELRQEIEKWWFPYARQNKLPKNAIYFLAEYKRSYPCGRFLGQVLQSVREDKDMKTGQPIPTGGLELYFNQILQGKPGKRKLLRSPRYALDRGELLEKPQHGADVYLTVDHYIQAIAEEEIEKGVKLAGAKSGRVVIMQPHTGEILAMAQYPFFYPDQYRKFYSNSNLLKETKVKSITDCFEPGSVMKAISIAIALKANKELVSQGKKPLFNPQEKLNLDKVKFPGRKKPIRDVSTARFLNMNLALQKSSNVYVSHVVQKVVDELGERWYRDQLYKVFGFGQKTEIELPSESPGFVPEIGKTYPNGRLQWSVPTPGCLSMGYNLLVNSVQVARAFAVLCNGGYKINPTLIKKIEKKDLEGNLVIQENFEKKEKVHVLDSDIADRVIESVKFSTKPGGTAFRGDIPGFTQAGKTSTSEKIQKGVYANKVHFTTFAGFAPAKSAKFVIIVNIDEPAYRFLPGIGKTHYGGKSAAPVFREIAKKVLSYMGELPDDPYGYQVGDPRRDGKKADMLKEVKELRELFLKWHR